MTASNYVVVGAVGGTCCGGYANSNSIDPGYEMTYNHSYKINTNSGGSYCASDDYYKETSKSMNRTCEDNTFYASPSKWCVLKGCTYPTDQCYCSDSEDPKMNWGNICE